MSKFLLEMIHRIRTVTKEALITRRKLFIIVINVSVSDVLSHYLVNTMLSGTLKGIGSIEEIERDGNTVKTENTLQFLVKVRVELCIKILKDNSVP